MAFHLRGTSLLWNLQNAQTTWKVGVRSNPLKTVKGLASNFDSRGGAA